MNYTQNMYNLVNDLERRLQANLNIINEYQVPKSTYDKTIKNIKFIDSQVNDAFKRGESEDRIASVIANNYIPYAEKQYDYLRWYMNRTG